MPVRTLTDRRGVSFRFDAGAVALDFGYSGGEGEWAVFETLHTPGDLRAWLAAPPLSAHVSAPVSVEELAEAKAVRHAILVGAFARAAGAGVPAEAAAILNAAARRAPLAPQLDGAVTRWAEPVDMSQVLSTLAREAIALLTGPLAGRIRQCAADDCPLVFVDTSRPGTRRWCSMERCGNRHKLRTFRSRARDEQPA